MKPDEKKPLNEEIEQGAVVEETNTQEQPAETKPPEAEIIPEPEIEKESDQPEEKTTDETEAGTGAGEGTETQDEKPAPVAYAIRKNANGQLYLEGGILKTVNEETAEFEEGFAADLKDVFLDHEEGNAEIENRLKV